MKETLTPQEEALIPVIRDKWLSLMFDKEKRLMRNEAKATEFVHFLYEISDLKVPKVVFADGIWEAQLMANAANKWGIDCLSKPDTLKKILKFPLTYESFSGYGNFSDYGWCAFFDFFTEIGVINHPEFNKFSSLLQESGVHDMIQYDELCIVVWKPHDIHRNNDNRLHNTRGPAVVFGNGEKYYFVSGSEVPAEWVETPESITKEVWLRNNNAEQRRLMVEILKDRALPMPIAYKEIDRHERTTLGFDGKPRTEVVKLLRSVEKDDIIQDYIVLANVTCPSTGREYHIPVPPEVTTAAEAIPWTFGMTAANYAPMFES